ncbi:hypothetical protein [Actinomadura macrotermitis]|uniref:Uncharacterized protein n=1 Tax=Actinomadura macrotermitis TaxID=2585200 RepID=A0A7K0BS53_9ACTN|nr:hypothetical protein [Actinomadura macrotermitis]MQY03712.1 hypothetical protein [Actinomadura macrotermitis]
MLSAALLLAPAAAAVPADAGCTGGSPWLCTVAVAGHHAPAAAGAAPRAEAEPMCAEGGGADHCAMHFVTPRVATADVVQMARAGFALPAPRPHTSPARRTWVGLPTFLWVDAGAWRERRASVTVDGQTVTMTGRPVRVDWDLGEASLSCDGPGTPYRRGAVPSCAHTFGRAAARPYPVTATVRYAVAWTCTGACDAPGGTVGMLPARAGLRVAVGEIQTAAVQTGSGR